MGDRKTEKKIRNYRKFAIECLADAVKYDVERQHENDEKKLRKLEKKSRREKTYGSCVHT